MSNYFKLFVFLIGTVTVMFSSIAHAADLKIGYVDLQRAISESVAGKSAQSQYEVEVKKAQTEIDKKKADYEGQKASFSKQKESLNEKAQDKRQEEILSLERNLKRSFQDSQEDLRRKNAQIVSDLVKQLRTVVEQYGKDNGFSMIVEKGASSVLYADAKIDITQDILKKFDEVTKK